MTPPAADDNGVAPLSSGEQRGDPVAHGRQRAAPGARLRAARIVEPLMLLLLPDGQHRWSRTAAPATAALQRCCYAGRGLPHRRSGDAARAQTRTRTRAGGRGGRWSSSGPLGGRRLGVCAGQGSQTDIAMIENGESPGKARTSRPTKARPRFGKWALTSYGEFLIITGRRCFATPRSALITHPA